MGQSGVDGEVDFAVRGRGDELAESHPGSCADRLADVPGRHDLGNDRGADRPGNTVEFFLSRTRGIAAAKAFFRKALKHHREPLSITLDGHQPSHSALRRMGMNGEFNFRSQTAVKIRCCPYLNNVVEQDHRRVKCRLRSMLGFKTFHNCAARDHRGRAGAEDSQTPVRNSDLIAVESRGALALRHGRIAHAATVRSWFITPTILSAPEPLRGIPHRSFTLPYESVPSALSGSASTWIDRICLHSDVFTRAQFSLHFCELNCQVSC